MLTAYIDESGHPADPRCRFVGLGGLVASAENWARFEAAWQKVLDQFIHGEPFHMRDFSLVPGVKLYRGWTESRRRQFLGELINVILGTNARPTGCVVSLDAYEALPAKFQTFFCGPYYMAFQEVTKGAALQALEFSFPFAKGTEQVAMIFAHQSEMGTIKSRGDIRVENLGRAESLWRAMKEKTTYGQWMGSYTSAEPSELAPLQAADLFVYELTKEFENRMRRPKDAMRWALRKLLPMGRQPLLVKFYTMEIMTQTLIDCGALKLDSDTEAALSVDASLHKIGMRELLSWRINANDQKKQ